MELPLSGIRILELATMIAAPTASRLLCAYGAEVIKVEKPAGDEMREAGIAEKVICEEDKNPLFTVHNSNKALISIDLKTEEGMAVMLRLLAQSDVFLTNVRLPALRRLGLDYDRLKDRFPRLIYALFTGYGSKGPEAGLPGFDATVFWMKSGPTADWQEKGARPMVPSYGFGDMATSSSVACGILMALLARQRTGKGTLLQSSLYASAIWCNSTGTISTQPPFNRDPRPTPETPPDPLAYHYLCGDGEWIGFFDGSYPRDCVKIAGLLGIEDLFADPRYHDLQVLHQTGEIRRLTRAVEEAMLKKSSTEWFRIFNENNIICQLAHRSAEICQDPQALENDYVEQVAFGDDLSVYLPAPPIQFSAYDRRPTVSAGPVGRDTDAVLENAGYSSGEIAQLKAIGAVK